MKKNVSNEQKMIASAYVNYGPTTNNGLAELAARENTQRSSDGGVGGMLLSSLEDGFKALYPTQMPSAFPQECSLLEQEQQWKSTTSQWPEFTSTPSYTAQQFPRKPGELMHRATRLYKCKWFYVIVLIVLTILCYTCSMEFSNAFFHDV